MTKIKVAIQGIATSFHEVAAQKYFGENIKSIPCMEFVELCETLKNNEADYAVMAIENTVAGSLMQNYGLLQEYHFKIIGEVYLRIEMMLMALPGTSINNIHTIQSHPIALRQCHQHLKKLSKVTLSESEDTAVSARNIKLQNLVGQAAIANKAAAELFDLEIIAENIESNPNNFTRFVVLSKDILKDAQQNNKASLFFNLGHLPGSLAKVLDVFAQHNINLTKIQSVPIMGKPYKYNFHVDVLWEDYQHYTQALAMLKDYTVNLSVLGEYPKGDFDFEIKE